MRKPILLLSLLCVTACGTTTALKQPSEASVLIPVGESRIRIFAQNGVDTKLYKETDCIPAAPKSEQIVWQSGGIGHPLRAWFGSIRSEGIGMPATESSTTVLENATGRSGTMSALYFRELAVPSNIPLLLHMQIDGITLPQCRTLAMGFLPQSQTNYELGMIVSRNGCQLVMNQLVLETPRSTTATIEAVSQIKNVLACPSE